MKKDIKFSTRKASADREKIRALAAKAHMSMSDYVTACCLGKRIVVIDEQKELLRQLKGIGSNINRLTDLTPQQIAQANAQAQELLNKPKCPTCGSTNIKKMGGIERGASIAAFGLFSKKINKTFKCSNCGYTW